MTKKTDAIECLEEIPSGATCHYERKNGEWWVVWGEDFGKGGRKKCADSASMEYAYQIGKQEAISKTWGELLNDEQIRQVWKDYYGEPLIAPALVEFGRTVSSRQRDLIASFYQSKINEAYDLLESNASFWKDGGVVIVLNKSEWASLKARYQKGVK